MLSILLFEKFLHFFPCTIYLIYVVLLYTETLDVVRRKIKENFNCITNIAIINKFDSITVLVGSRHVQHDPSNFSTMYASCMRGPHAIRPVNMHYSNMMSCIIELLLSKEKE